MHRFEPRRRERGRLYEVPLIILAACLTLSVTVPAVADGSAGIGSWACTVVASLLLLVFGGLWVAMFFQHLWVRFRRKP